MSRRKISKKNRKKTFGQKNEREPKMVDSLFNAIQEGNEYGSIVSAKIKPGLELFDDVVRGIKEIEEIRKRPCLSYVGNVVRMDEGQSGVDTTDDLPFLEMLQSVSTNHKKIDVYLATRGGSAQQISRFVNGLRSRFDEVNFIIPSFCMSAGTLFALSGDNIWMTERACLGPIDPQVPTREGRFVPAQAVLLLINNLQKEGQDAIDKGENVPWTAVRIIDSIDKKELGDAITATNYSTMMASQFLVDYKFKNWTVRQKSGKQVTTEYKKIRATEIAEALASHDRWKNHGHAISREVLWDEIKLKIEHPDTKLEKSIIKLWAIFNWIFDKTSILKMIVSENYRYCKFSPPSMIQKKGNKNDR